MCSCAPAERQYGGRLLKFFDLANAVGKRDHSSDISHVLLQVDYTGTLHEYMIT
jgi:hypothetical protein